MGMGWAPEFLGPHFPPMVDHHSPGIAGSSVKLSFLTGCRWRVKCKVIEMLGYEPTWKSLSLICKLARHVFGFHLGYFGLSDFDFLQFRGRFDWKTPVHPHCQGSNPPRHQVKSSASAQLAVLFAYFWMEISSTSSEHRGPARDAATEAPGSDGSRGPRTSCSTTLRTSRTLRRRRPVRSWGAMNFMNPTRTNGGEGGYSD